MRAERVGIGDAVRPPIALRARVRREPLARTSSVLDLQRRAGNRATSALIRGGSIAATSPQFRIDREKDKPRKSATESASAHFSNRALARADEISHVQSAVIEKLKKSFERLGGILPSYEKGHEGFRSALEAADTANALRSSRADTVMGLYIGAIVGVLGPGQIISKQLSQSVQSKWTSIAGRARAGVRVLRRRARPRLSAATTRGAELLGGLVDESFSAATAAPLASKAESVEASAGLGGRSVLDQFKHVVEQMGALVSSLPDLMPKLRSQTALARKVKEILRGTNDPDLIQAVSELDAGSAEVTTEVKRMVGPFDSLVARVLKRPQQSPLAVERELWTTWVAKLDGDHDKLNHTEIRERIEKVGLRHLFEGTVEAMTGPYAGEKIGEQSAKRIELNAQIAWLGSRGVAAAPKTETGASARVGVKAYFKMAQLAERYESETPIGAEGKFIGGTSVRIGGKKYKSWGTVPPAASSGGQVFVDGHWPTMSSIRVSAAEFMKDGTRNYLWSGVDKKGEPESHGLVLKWKMYRDMDPFRYPIGS